MDFCYFNIRRVLLRGEGVLKSRLWSACPHKTVCQFLWNFVIGDFNHVNVYGSVSITVRELQWILYMKTYVCFCAHFESSYLAKYLPRRKDISVKSCGEEWSSRFVSITIFLKSCVFI